MHLLAYWRWDNYVGDLDEGAGFNFNSKQSRLHSAIDVGETLWLFTALKAPPRYFLAAKLVVRSKTLNAPGYRYGKYRLWGDLARSRYFRVRADVPQDEAFELLRGLPLVSGSLAKTTRTTLPQGCQTIRGVTPEGHHMLEAFARSLETEERAYQVIDEYTLERGLVADEPWLAELLRRGHTGASAERVERLLAGVRRDRRLVRELHELYRGKCQVCAFDSPAVYGVPSAEGHHLVYLSRGGEDNLANVVLLCPTHHAVVHQADATFDHGRLAFLFAKPLLLSPTIAAPGLTVRRDGSRVALEETSDDQNKGPPGGSVAAGPRRPGAPQPVAAGSPAAIADVNGDGIPDLIVANQGSNDVSVLFGNLDAGGHWYATSGPRLRSGGLGPVATTLRDLNGDGIPDLVVTNSQSGDFSVLPGRGQGFFDPRSPELLVVPGQPILGAPSFFGSSDAGVVVAGNGQLISFNLDAFATTVQTITVERENVAAAAAMANGDLVTTGDDGSVTLLTPEPFGQSFEVAQTLTPLTGLPPDPSALDVQEGPAGLQALVTSQGEDQVFLFAAQAETSGGGFEATSAGLAPLVPSGLPVTQATTPDNVPFAIVLTEVEVILGGPGPNASATAAALRSPGEEGAAEGFVFIASRGLDSEGKKAERDESDGPPPAPGPGLEPPPRIGPPSRSPDLDSDSSPFRIELPPVLPEQPTPLEQDSGMDDGLSAFLPLGGNWLTEALRPVSATRPALALQARADLATTEPAQPLAVSEREETPAAVESADAGVPLSGLETSLEQSPLAIPIAGAEGPWWRLGSERWPLVLLAALSAGLPGRSDLPNTLRGRLGRNQGSGSSAKQTAN